MSFVIIKIRPNFRSIYCLAFWLVDLKFAVKFPDIRMGDLNQSLRTRTHGLQRFSIVFGFRLVSAISLFLLSSVAVENSWSFGNLNIHISSVLAETYNVTSCSICYGRLAHSMSITYKKKRIEERLLKLWQISDSSSNSSSSDRTEQHFHYRTLDVMTQNGKSHSRF